MASKPTPTPPSEMKIADLLAQFEMDVLNYGLAAVRDIRALASYQELCARTDEFQSNLTWLYDRCEGITEPKVVVAWQLYIMDMLPTVASSRTNMPEFARFTTGKVLKRWVIWAKNMLKGGAPIGG